MTRCRTLLPKAWSVLFLMTWAGTAALATSLPAKIEAEAYASMSGVKLEDCSEGTQNVGWIDAKDWMVYPITVPVAGRYIIQYRVASAQADGIISTDINAGSTVLGTLRVPNTGGWQNWTTIQQVVTLNAGTFNLGLYAKAGGWNLNWITIEPEGDPTVYTPVPARIEAEGFSAMQGIGTEPCSEGGQNVGWTDPGDWMNYPIRVATTGEYTLQYRVSSPSATGILAAELASSGAQLGEVNIPNTGGWQNWKTLSQKVSLKAGSHHLRIKARAGGWNLNWINITSGPSPSTLIPLNQGMQMTVQFENNTRGVYANHQIFAAVVARNRAGQLSYLKPSGELVPCATSDNGALHHNGTGYANYFYPISDFNGFQFPPFLDSGRLYVSMGRPLYIRINQDINGHIGVAFPDINNPTDPNQEIYFDWLEFAVLNNQIWCNTTQVDMFGLPITMELYKGSANDYSTFGKVGITETREAILNAWTNEVPSEFQHLKQAFRIVAPTHGDFKPGRPYGQYFDAYINAMWDQYSRRDLVLNMPQGTFTGRVQGDGRFRFVRASDGSTYVVNKPSTTDVFQGSGSLASGNDLEKAIEAQICAAFHRHVMGDVAIWKTPSAYYPSAPADYFAQFWHRHSLQGLAYGFCYDDVNDQSSTMTTPSPRGLVIGIGW